MFRFFYSCLSYLIQPLVWLRLRPGSAGTA